MSFLFGLLGKAKMYAIGALGAIAAVLAALVYGMSRGRKDGAAAVIAQSAQSSIKAVEARNTIEAKIAKQPEGAAQTTLKKTWSRD